MIQDLDKYVQEGTRQLSDGDFYVETTDDLTLKHNDKVTQVVRRLFEKGEISQKVYEYLSMDSPRTSLFYLLPKIHKDKCNQPGRPIVSANDCPTERISQLVDHFLQLLLIKNRSHLRDTTDFINCIKSLG